MRKMNRFIPVALACAIFAAQPVQAATIIRDSDKQTTSQNTQTTTAGTQPEQTDDKHDPESPGWKRGRSGI